MNKKPKITVIVPAFNEEKTISSCLSALLSQDFPKEDYEILVVNNASTDKTALVAKKFKVEVIEEERKGNVFALIKGFSKARGEIIAITDADALVPVDWLSKIERAFKKDKRVVLVGGRSKFTPKTWLSSLAEPVLLLSGKYLKLTNCFNLAIKKDCYQEIGGFSGKINFNQDAWICLEAKKHGKSIFLVDNTVVSSSRHLNGIVGIADSLKSILNVFWLFLFERTIFFEFGDVREK